MEVIRNLDWNKMLEILNRLDFFKQFSSYEKRKTIIMKTQLLIFRENEYLVKEKSSENTFFIIVEGLVIVFKIDKELFDDLEPETREKFKDYIIKRLVERMDDLNDIIIKSKLK